MRDALGLSPMKLSTLPGGLPRGELTSVAVLALVCTRLRFSMRLRLLMCLARSDLVEMLASLFIRLLLLGMLLFVEQLSSSRCPVEYWSNECSEPSYTVGFPVEFAC